MSSCERELNKLKTARRKNDTYPDFPSDKNENNEENEANNIRLCHATRHGVYPTVDKNRAKGMRNGNSPGTEKS